MVEEKAESVWKNSRFVRLYAAHAASLVGSGIGTAAIALLADGLRPGAGPQVLGIVLTIRILIVPNSIKSACCFIEYNGHKSSSLYSS